MVQELESQAEALFRDLARAHGAMALKFTSPGTAGVPDRIVLMPDGTTRLVELKRPGGRVSAVQEATFRRMAAIGHPVEVLHGRDEVREWWDAL